MFGKLDGAVNRARLDLELFTAPSENRFFTMLSENQPFNCL